MTGPQWEMVKRLFHDALDRPVDGRTAWLAQQCREDPEVGAEVERLIAAHMAAGSFIETPVADLHGEQPPPSGARVGTRLGPYRLDALLGAGGMGEVYRARDSKLHRDVAIKVLPEAVATAPEQLARFEREAQALAALNHPNIAAVYAVETSEDVPAIVMELVGGEDLSARIQRGPIPLAEALLLARQIADALAAAHEAGIIHRDLKPANIKVKDDGTVKVLDFGLAKAVKPPGYPSADDVNSPKTSAHATSRGVIMGTTAYMAPEQARGKTVDKRADIWAFGVVLYEMLTGKQLFAADEMSDTLAHVLTREPDWAALPAATPAPVRRLLVRCLTKDVKQRLHDISDARLEIDEAVGPAAEPQPTPMTSARALHRERLVWATGLAAALLAPATVAYFGRGSHQPRPAVTQSTISIAPADTFPSYGIEMEGRPSPTAMALSPSGRTVVFSGIRGDKQQLFRLDLDKLEAVPMAGTDWALSPFFSPDGKWVGFWASGALHKVALGGGPVTKVCDLTGSFSGASWGSDDTIVYSGQSGGLWLVPSGGGTPKELTTLDSKAGEYGHWLPQFLPDGKTVVFTVVNHFIPDYRTGARLWVVAPSGERRELGLGEGADARYASSGHLVFARAGTLVAAPFDVATREVTGDALTVLDDVMQAAYTPRGSFETGAGQFSLSSESGTLVYVPGGVFPDTDQPVVSVDRDGTAKVLPGMPPRRYLGPRLSLDQSKLLVWSQGVDRTVWTYDIARGILTPLTTAGRNSWPIWGPDGKLTYSGSSGGGADSLFLMPADGSGPAEPLTTPEVGLIRQPSSWNGRTLAFIEVNAGTPVRPFTVMTLSLDGDHRPAPFLPTGYAAASSTPEFSPDGRYLAYSYFIKSSRIWEVYVRPYPGPGGGKQISNGGGLAPAWSRDGRELFYVTGTSDGGIRMMAVPIVTMTPSPIFGQPYELFRGRYKQPTNLRNYEVTKDGQRFFLTRLPENPPIRVTQMVLVQNWLEELKVKVPSGR